MPIVQLGLLAQVAVEFDDDVTALLLFLLVLIRRTLASRSAKPVLVSWLSLGYFPRDMHIAEMFDFVGAPEEIRTPDPQIRRLMLLRKRVLARKNVPIVNRQYSRQKVGNVRMCCPAPSVNPLQSLALPRGLEPLFSP
jgi:hypothetical protein